MTAYSTALDPYLATLFAPEDLTDTLGEVVARIFVRTRSAADHVLERISGAFSYDDVAPSTEPLVIDRLSPTTTTS